MTTRADATISPSSEGAPPDRDGTWPYGVGAVCAFVLVAGYLLTFPLYAWVGGAPPRDLEAQLAYFGEHAAGWWIILALMVLTDLLYIPIFLAIYHASRSVSRYGALLACGFMGMFVALDLSLTWTAHASLITSGVSYATATGAHRAALITAAAYPSAMLQSPLLGIYTIVLPALGILIAGIVMVRGVFNRATAYLALAAGVSGIAYTASYVSPSLDAIRIVNALLVTVWFAFVGHGLYRLGHR